MKVFISHSGNRSFQLAKLFQEWLPNVIQNVEPWISDDIKKGKLWRGEISSALEDTKIGIICLTQSNLTEPWILFEAGALSKTRDAVVSTFLLDNQPSDITGPLSDFQHTIFTEDDIRKLVDTINEQQSLNNEKTLSKQRLDIAFKKYWDEFNDSATKIKSSKEGNIEIKRTKRQEDDILYEILDRVRRIESSENIDRDLIERIPMRQAILQGVFEEESKNHEMEKNKHIADSIQGQLTKETMILNKMKTHGASRVEISKKTDEIKRLLELYHKYTPIGTTIMSQSRSG